MTIAEYQTLTGKTVSEAEAPRIKAVIRRSEAKLETLLGYSLSRQNKWTELGRVEYNGLVPFPSLPVGAEVLSKLLPAPEQTGDIQLFNFDELDTHIRIAPAKEVYRVMLVLPVSRDEFITIQELQNASPYLNSAGLVTAISRYRTWFAWSWWDTLTLLNKSNLMLAVDASYVNVCDANRYPDLSFLLADMISYYSDPAYSLMGNILSETIDSHTYHRGTTNKSFTSTDPEDQPNSKLVIDRYAGPGAFRKLVR